MSSTADFSHCIGNWPTSSALNDAIDVVARLTEQADRMAGKGENELAMSQALGATFGYMVAYCHHLTVDRRLPGDALAQAAAGMPELESDDLDFLHTASRGLPPHSH